MYFANNKRPNAIIHSSIIKRSKTSNQLSKFLKTWLHYSTVNWDSQNKDLRLYSPKSMQWEGQSQKQTCCLIYFHDPLLGKVGMKLKAPHVCFILILFTERRHVRREREKTLRRINPTSQPIVEIWVTIALIQAHVLCQQQTVQRHNPLKNYKEIQNTKSTLHIFENVASLLSRELGFPEQRT